MTIFCRIFNKKMLCRNAYIIFFGTKIITLFTVILNGAFGQKDVPQHHKNTAERARNFST